MAFLISLRTIPVRQGAEGGLLGPQSGAAQSEAKLFPKAWGPGQAGRSCRPVPDPGGTPRGTAPAWLLQRNRIIFLHAPLNVSMRLHSSQMENLNLAPESCLKSGCPDGVEGLGNWLPESVRARASGPPFPRPVPPSAASLSQTESLTSLFTPKSPVFLTTEHKRAAGS